MTRENAKHDDTIYLGAHVEALERAMRDRGQDCFSMVLTREDDKPLRVREEIPQDKTDAFCIMARGEQARALRLIWEWVQAAKRFDGVADD